MRAYLNFLDKTYFKFWVDDKLRLLQLNYIVKSFYCYCIFLVYIFYPCIYLRSPQPHYPQPPEGDFCELFSACNVFCINEDRTELAFHVDSVRQNIVYTITRPKHADVIRSVSSSNENDELIKAVPSPYSTSNDKLASEGTIVDRGVPLRF